MKKIAILTESFVGWNGGVDFIKQIILALDSVSKEKKIKLYIFFIFNNKYKKYKGIKRLFLKIYEKFLSDLVLKDLYPGFEDFSSLRFVQYSGGLNLKRALDKFNIETILPHMNPEYYDFKINSIGYLYDCQHKYFPEFFSKEDIVSRNSFFTSMVNKNKRIIVNANSVKDDLIEFYKANPDNIFVLPFTPKLNQKYLENNHSIISKYNLPKRYFISSNQFWLHKDHPTLYKAFAEFIKKEEYKDFELICTGLMEDSRRPNYINDLNNLLKDLGIQNKVRCLGLIPKLEQIEIMKSAVAVIQTTLFEGGPGGGSVWDAASLGIPAIISNIKTNLEITNTLNEIIFFESKDYQDLSDKMEKLMLTSLIRPSHYQLKEQSTLNTKILGEALYKLF